MEFISKLRSTVSSVTATVGSVLPGNPVTREYEPVEHIASAGPWLCWKIYSGFKYTNKQEVAIWLFERKSVDKWQKQDRDLLFETLKKGVSQLTRLRHPRLLVVEHPLEESRESLAFATEPIFASLANALGRIDNMPAIVPPELSEFTLDAVEIRHGLMQIGEALTFLHNDACIIHRNICPESIVINKTGDWKVTGFDFCVQGSRSAPGQPVSFPMADWSVDLNPFLQPSLNFLAPEYVSGGKCDGSADLFSCGLLSYAVFNKGRPLQDYESSINLYKKKITELKTLAPSQLMSIPDEFREYVKMCLNFTPGLRPDATQFTKIPYFDNIGVKTLNCLDSLGQLDNLQKSQFFKGLPKILSHIPRRLQLSKVLYSLTGQFQTPEMIPFVLPAILTVAQNATKAEYQSIVFPALYPVFAIRSPIQVILILLQNMDLLLSKTSPDDIVKYLLPVVYAAMEANNFQIQELCLAIIPNIVQFVDQTSMKTHLVPKLLKLITAEASILSVKVNALLCIGKLLESLERWMVRDQILPELPKIGSKEPAVLMAILGIYRLAFSSAKLGISKESCARSALPFLLPLCVENSLNLSQFSAFISLVKDMLTKIESEQRVKLEQLSAMQEEQRQGVDFNSVLTAANVSSPQQNGNLPDVFKSLGLEELNGPHAGSANAASPNMAKAGVPLTLEEKQRLAREQEQTQKLRTQTPLKPAGSAKQASPAAPKDLTASLMAASASGVTPNRTTPMLGAPPPPGNPLQKSPFSASNLNSLGGLQTSPMPASFGLPLQSTSSLTNMSAFAMSPSSTKPTATTTDLSAFDDLVSMNSGKKSAPMGSFVPGPAIRPSPQTFAGVPPLSGPGPGIRASSSGFQGGSNEWNWTLCSPSAPPGGTGLIPGPPPSANPIGQQQFVGATQQPLRPLTPSAAFSSPNQAKVMSSANANKTSAKKNDIDFTDLLN